MAVLDTSFLNNVTREKFLKVLKNNLYYKTVLFNRLIVKGKVQDMTGRSLLWDVVAKKHSSIGIYSGYDVFANQPVNPTAQASLSTSNYYAAMAISGEEERKNTGSMERLLDMLKVQIDNANASLRDLMATDLYSDGTTVGGRARLVGLAAIVGSATVNSTTNTYANINRSTAGNSYWQPQYDATAHTFVNLTDPTSSEWLPALMRTSHLGATFDGSPDLIVTTIPIYNMYQNIAASRNLRFNNEVANLGFGGVEFGAGVTMVFDRYTTANHMYFLNTDAFSVFVFSGADFDLLGDGWVRPPNQDAKIAHIIWSGQMRCDTPREQAVICSIATS